VFLIDQCFNRPVYKIQAPKGLSSSQVHYSYPDIAWSGSRDAARYIQELESVIGKSSRLKYFDPIDLQLNTDQEVITTIVECLNLRIKRTGQSEYFSDFSSLGVTLSFFEKFIEENNCEAPRTGILPLTRSWRIL
jgi:hypothetical protein